MSRLNEWEEAKMEWPKLLDGEEWIDAETILGKCCRPRPRLVCVDGEVVDEIVMDGGQRNELVCVVFNGVDGDGR